MENNKSREAAYPPHMYIGAVFGAIFVLVAVGALWLWTASHGIFKIYSVFGMILPGLVLSSVSKEKPIHIGVLALALSLIGIVVVDVLETMVILQIPSLGLNEYLNFTFTKLGDNPFRIIAYLITPIFAFILTAFGNSKQ